MSYRLTQVEATFFPSEAAVREAYSRLGLLDSDFRDLLQRFVCTAPVKDGVGYQMAVADQLQTFLGRTCPLHLLGSGPALSTALLSMRRQT